MKIVIVSGARPNYMKIAPIVWAIRRLNQTSVPKLEFVLVHTGQHYDHNLFGVFFEELGLPAPDFCLDVGSGSRNYQIETVIERLEPVLEKAHPDLVLVVGDVNSTLAAALAGVKRRIQVAHVEAGLRSFDQTMPEEINRRLTDALSDYLFVTEESGRKNLLREGVAADKIFFVGNVMIDSLQQLRRLWERAAIHDDMGLEKNGYGVVTLHRPSNVDNQEVLAGIVDALIEVARELPVIFPVHPRTQKQLEATAPGTGIVRFGERRVAGPGLYCIEPLGYLDFMALLAGARIVMTDSGGIQEEATVLNVPCLTLRENTERPVTITHGTNKLVGTSREKIIAESGQVLKDGRPALYPPPLWDGRAADRIVAVLNDQGRRIQPRRAAAAARSAVSRSDKPPLG